VTVNLDSNDQLSPFQLPTPKMVDVGNKQQCRVSRTQDLIQMDFVIKEIPIIKLLHRIESTHPTHNKLDRPINSIFHFIYKTHTTNQSTESSGRNILIGTD